MFWQARVLESVELNGFSRGPLRPFVPPRMIVAAFPFTRQGFSDNLDNHVLMAVVEETPTKTPLFERQEFID